MKKLAVFALVICLLVIAVAAVLSVTYPELQQKFVDFGREVGTRIGNFFRLFTEPFKQAFLRG